MAMLKVHEGPVASSRLADLGLTIEQVHNAVLAGEAEAAMCTPLDPPMARGLARYTRTVRVLREQTIPHGWTYDNPRNLCRTIDPDRDFAVIVAMGNELTGRPHASPSTKYAKGATVVDAVAHNAVQLELDLSLPSGAVAEPIESVEDRLATWVLLYFRDKGEIRFELSLPASMTGAYIDRWRERIILDPVPAEPAVVFGDDEQPPGEGYDVVVERR